MPTKRKPAQIVQCPYCTHKGSARGLFTHVRLAHPSKGYIKPPISEKVSVHPYACNGDIPSFDSGGKISFDNLTKHEKDLFDMVIKSVMEKVSHRSKPFNAEKFAENFVTARKAILETIERVRNSKGYPKGMNG